MASKPEKVLPLMEDFTRSFSNYDFVTARIIQNKINSHHEKIQIEIRLYNPQYREALLKMSTMMYLKALNKTYLDLQELGLIDEIFMADIVFRELSRLAQKGTENFRAWEAVLQTLNKRKHVMSTTPEAIGAMMDSALDLNALTTDTAPAAAQSSSAADAGAALDIDAATATESNGAAEGAQAEDTAPEQAAAPAEPQAEADAQPAAPAPAEPQAEAAEGEAEEASPEQILAQTQAMLNQFNPGAEGFKPELVRGAAMAAAETAAKENVALETKVGLAAEAVKAVALQKANREHKNRLA